MNPRMIYIILILMVLLFAGSLIKDWRSPVKRKNKERPGSPEVKNALEITLPLRLQAYERLVLYLERIKPQVLLQRLKGSSNVRDKELQLTKAVRSEYEHNVAQQIYVSFEAWDAVTSAKEQLIHLIHSTASRFSPEEDSADFCKEFLYASMQGQKFPVAVALKILNAESKKLLALSDKI